MVRIPIISILWKLDMLEPLRPFESQIIAIVDEFDSDMELLDLSNLKVYKPESRYFSAKNGPTCARYQQLSPLSSESES